MVERRLRQVEYQAFSCNVLPCTMGSGETNDRKGAVSGTDSHDMRPKREETLRCMNSKLTVGI